ncbi:hypothetical protein AMST5_03023 [freshwater sediment metagenome]|uniref:DUF262 domain-containing protein n=1 Tax=freshwater sediment metagenome TaxID=556182 RepID=A0AA48M4U1_9ZZZZ
MQPSYLELLKIFGAETRHTVPLFQRPYVWNEADNWEPLWDDISELADRIVATSDPKFVRGHFLGTVVLEQVPHPTGSIAMREIIDGQQRLTTLQIVLHAVQHAFEELKADASEAGDEQGAKAAEVASRQITGLTFNSGYGEDEEKYKVWPTNEDRAPFRQVMDAAKPSEIPTDASRMATAYHYFLGKARAWLGAGGMTERIKALSGALKDHLRLIVLDLEDRDEPQAIFETLNAHGTPLLPADLIKNWLLWEASEQKLSLQKLYNSYWLPFDRDHEYWRKEVGTGHAARARIDTYLQNWLSRRLRESVPVKHLYDRFVSHVEADVAASRNGAPCDVQALLKDIEVNASRFRVLTHPAENNRFEVAVKRLATMGVVAFHPFLLGIMGREASDQYDRDEIATILESYLLRRMVCNYETRGYVGQCMKLLEALDGIKEGPAAGKIREALSQADSKVIQWPDDEAFERDWCRRPFYNNIRRDRVAMILQAIEEHYQRSDKKSEPIVKFDFDKLQIEHILPQSWRANWPVNSDEAASLRDSKVNAIGNLTLVSDKLNPTLSNASWLDPAPDKKGKHSALNDHSMLRLNAGLVSSHQTHWDEACIDLRAKELFRAAREIWPHPSSMDQAGS